MRAIARSRRFRIPPEYVPARRSAASSRSIAFSSSEIRSSLSPFGRWYSALWRRRFSRPVSSSSIPTSWAAYPMILRMAAGSLSTLIPSTIADPDVFLMSVVITLIVVVLPAANREGNSIDRTDVRIEDLGEILDLNNRIALGSPRRGRDRRTLRLRDARDGLGGHAALQRFVALKGAGWTPFEHAREVRPSPSWRRGSLGARFDMVAMMPIAGPTLPDARLEVEASF